MKKNPVVVRLNALTSPMSEEERTILGSIKADIIEIEGQTDKEILSACRSADAVMIVSAYLHGPVIKKLLDLKVISRLGTGVDKIDVDEATRLGIIVANLPDFSTEEVADHTMALLLAAARQLKYHEGAMRQGIKPKTVEHLHRLSAQKLGIIGFGRIGRAVAKRAQSFGLDVLIIDPAITVQQAKKANVTVVDFDTILASSDYLSLLCPLTRSTRHMLTLREFKKMKPAAVLVNTGRGELINEKDLVLALRKGIIRYASLDVYGGINVFAEEGFSIDHPLFFLDNVLLTPHVSANSEESSKNAHVGGALAVVAVFSGKYPAHVVNPDVVPRIPLKRAVRTK
jgi:D-3-phosphoglycerate dehydrogenase / 2-oxoglutarate reductase